MNDLNCLLKNGEQLAGVCYWANGLHALSPGESREIHIRIAYEDPVTDFICRASTTPSDVELMDFVPSI